MGYVDIVNIVMFFIFNIVLLIFPLQYVFYILVGLFSKKKVFPGAEKKLRYGVVICARNEEKVIGNLIDSIRKCDYPQELLDIFVIAHNCTDGTARAARSRAGTVVYEYNNDAERTKGHALHKIFELIERDFGIMRYDGFHVFDADNVLDTEYFTKMNDAFLAYDREYAVTAFRNAKNFGENAITAMYGLSYIVDCSLFSVGSEALHCSTRLLGSGFLVSAEMVRDGWNSVILSDDSDFTADQILQGRKVVYCGEAMYYDEHPTTFRAMWRQRLRWAKGALLVCKTRMRGLFAEIFGKRKDAKNGEKRKKQWRSALNLLGALVPMGALGFFAVLINIILLCFSPFCGYDLGSVLLQYLIVFCICTAIPILLMMLGAIICYKKEKRRIRGVSFRVKAKSVLLWPFFLFMLVPLQIQALFTRRFEWKPIEHSDAADHESFNRES